MDQKMELMDWFFKEEPTFTSEDVKILIDEIKKFNAGVIDEYLNNHVDQVFEKWIKDFKESQ